MSVPWARWAAYALPTALAMWGLQRVWPHTIDDAFVFLQYARNLIEGQGLVFNPGERVEGHSNTLWVLCIAAGGGVGIPWLVWLKQLGALSTIAAIASSVWLAERFTQRSSTDSVAPVVAAALVGALLACHPGVAFYGAAGMDVSLAMLLMSLGVGSAALDLHEHGMPTERRCYVPLALLALTRPEAPLVIAAVGAQRLWLARQERPALAREAAALGMALAPLVALGVFRLSYYGALLPNTFAAKPSTLLSDPGVALQYLYDSAASPGLAAIAVLGGAVYACVQPSDRAAVAALLVPAGAQIGFALYSGGDWMPHGRFVLPALPLVAVAASVPLCRAKWPLWIGAALLVGLTLRRAHAFWGELDDNRAHDHALRSQNNQLMGRWMRSHLPQGASVLTDEIGAIGFESRLRVHDLWGLVDPEVAALLRGLGFNPYNSPTGGALRDQALDATAKLLLARRPDYITIDYRAPAPSSADDIDRAYYLPFTMRGLARYMGDDYRFVRAFPLMTDPPKTFLLFARAPAAVRAP